MQVVVLTAGLGTRMRPHTFTRPKSLIEVAGKPLLAHILDPLLVLDIDKLIIITGYLGEQIEAFVQANYALPTCFITQTELRGQAHAIALAHEHLAGPTVIVFGDGIIGADLNQLRHARDGVLHVQAVDDPTRFGVAVVEHGLVTRLVEKPRTPVSNLAVLGIYYVPEARHLLAAIQQIMQQNIQLEQEFYLADALQVMIDQGARFQAMPVSHWVDCGTIPALFETNRFLLDHGHHGNAGHLLDSVIIPPVSIAATARIERSVIGPYVSVAAGACIEDARIRDTLVGQAATLRACVLQQSIIGAGSHIEGPFQHLNVGAACQVG